MPPVKGQMRRYKDEDVKQALKEVQDGNPVATIARKYGIPRVTLLYKFTGKSPINRKMGPQPYLSAEQETILVKWIKECAKAGFPIQTPQLINSVQNLMLELKQKNVFKNNKPGRTWLAGFLRRNPELNFQTPQNLISSKAGINRESIVKWFHYVHSYLENNNYHKILNKPERVFSCDETAFFLNPKGNKILALKGSRNIYQQVNPEEKECLTVLFTANAAGELVPPAVIFKYEQIPKDLVMSVPREWGIGKSDTGWMTGESFFEYVTNVFDKWLNKMDIARPVILFVDGQSSNLTLHLSNFCKEHGIILLALLPHANHILQPIDRAFFQTMKKSWKEAFHKWQYDHSDSKILQKVHFSPLLKTVIDETVTPLMLQNGFRNCGLVPWNIDAISSFANVEEHFEQIEEHNQIFNLINGITCLEKYIAQDKLRMFKVKNTWNGDIQDFSLFELYKRIEKDIQEKSGTNHIGCTQNNISNDDIKIEPELDLTENAEVTEAIDIEKIEGQEPDRDIFADSCILDLEHVTVYEYPRNQNTQMQDIYTRPFIQSNTERNCNNFSVDTPQVAGPSSVLSHKKHTTHF